MNNLSDSLPDLMHRATENLEPESTDLVERGMRHGATLRRRRSALLSVSGATAVVATAAIVFTGTQVFGGSAPAPASGPQSGDVVVTKTQAGGPVTQKETLATLLSLLPSDLKVSKQQTWGDKPFNGASAILDDGQGPSKLSISVSSNDRTCFQPQPGTCKRRSDGSLITTFTEQPVYSKDNNPGGVVYNSVHITRRDGESISVQSFNAVEEKQVEHSRAKPVLSVAELTKIADSKLWRFPPKQPVPTANTSKGEPKSPGAGKPTVPVQKTLQTLREVLPNGLQYSQPKVWGGGTGGFNRASYVVNDGNGPARVDAFVTHEVPVTRCAQERAMTFCQVRPDGSVIGWIKNAPQYSDARQAKDGVLQNSAEIHYPDGRFISLSSYNAVQEKGSRYTRPQPALTTDQLLAMAGNEDWKFPGTGTK